MKYKLRTYTRTFGMTKICSTIVTIQRAHHIIAMSIKNHWKIQGQSLWHPDH